MTSKSELRAQKYLIIAVTLGTLFGIIGSMLVTTLFRIIDILGGTTIEKELWYFGVSIFAFICIMVVFYLIVRDFDKKTK